MPSKAMPMVRRMDCILDIWESIFGKDIEQRGVYRCDEKCGKQQKDTRYMLDLVFIFVSNVDLEVRATMF